MADVPPQFVGAPSHAPHQRKDGLRMRGRDVADDGEDDEDDGPTVEQESLSPAERSTERCVAWASGFDLVASGIVVCASLSYAWRDSGVPLLCMGIQAISHWISSAMLMLRFKGESSFNPYADEATACGLLRKERRKWLTREQIGAITMGVVMLLSSVALLFKAFREIRFWTYWYKDHADMDNQVEVTLEDLALYGFSVYLTQAVFRFWAARKLKRSIIWHGFWASIASMFFLLIMGFAASFQKE